MWSKNHRLALMGILLLGLFLRFYRLDTIPSGLYVDEAVVGYNAFSLLKTGADEYGKRWPVLLRSFEAYSSPLYTYMTTASVAVMGLSVLAVRFLSAVAGSLSIVLVYLISGGSLWAAGLMAISPWGLFLSRMGTEGHWAFVLWLAGIYSYQKAKSKRVWLVLSFCLFGLSMNSYQAMRLMVPLTMCGLWFWLPLEDRWSKWTWIACLVFGLINLPQLLLLGTSSFGLRASGLFYGEAIRLAAKNNHWLPYPLVWFYYFLREFMSQLVTYFNPYTLFYLGDADLQRSVPEISVFYQWMVVPYLSGWYLLTKRWHHDEPRLILITALAAGIVPALTKDPFSAVRGQGLILPMVLVMARSMEEYEKRLKKIRILMLFLVALSLLNWWRYYFWVFPIERMGAWNYGYKPLVEEITKRPKDHFLVDQSRSKSPYIELLFYLRYPPEKYQKQFEKVRRNYYQASGDRLERSFGNVEIRNINWERDIYREQIMVADQLAISEAQAVEHKLKLIFEVKDLVGNIVFRGFETNPKEKCASDGYKSEECSYFRK